MTKHTNIGMICFYNQIDAVKTCKVCISILYSYRFYLQIYIYLVFLQPVTFIVVLLWHVKTLNTYNTVKKVNNTTRTWNVAQYKGIMRMTIQARQSVSILSLFLLLKVFRLCVESQHYLEMLD